MVRAFYESIPASNSNKIIYSEFEQYFEKETNQKINFITEKIEKHINNSNCLNLFDFLIENGATNTMNLHNLMRTFSKIGKISDNEVLFLARQV